MTGAGGKKDKDSAQRSNMWRLQAEWTRGPSSKKSTPVGAAGGGQEAVPLGRRPGGRLVALAARRGGELSAVLKHSLPQTISVAKKLTGSRGGQKH